MKQSPEDLQPKLVYLPLLLAVLAAVATLAPRLAHAHAALVP
jgi:hypothetical protein